MESRELDALVAEKIFGMSREEIDRLPMRGHVFGGHLPLPAYSSDLSAAWQVVEHITRIPMTPEEAEHAINTRFCFEWDKLQLWSMTTSEAAEAICLAALRAVGIDMKEARHE